jgi:outer membrane protein assembly factor BamA
VIAAFIVAVLMTAPPDALPGGAQGRETVAAIQVHGNQLTADEEIRRLAGIAIGSPVDDATIDEVASRLRATRRFERVQVLKRFASIADPTQILIVIIVNEGPVRIERTGDPDHPTRVVRNRRLNLMFLPVLYEEDGYGMTYGARLGLPEPAGKQSRVGFPLTWGGDKRAAAELDKTLAGGPLDRVTAGASISRRTNPFYEQDDDRARVWARGERLLTGSLRAGATIGWQRVSFLGSHDSLGDLGADITFDTRVDPILPRDAVYARAAWERIAGANRLDLDARGYLGLVGQNVLALRVQQSEADGPLPPFLKPLLGGLSNLRGFKVGVAAADSLTAASAELVVPLTSPISVGRIGVSGFIDAGTAYDHGQHFADQPWKEGIGGSVWFSAAFLRLNVAVAHGLGSSTRVHVGATATF